MACEEPAPDRGTDTNRLQAALDALVSAADWFNGDGEQMCGQCLTAMMKGEIP